MTAHEKKASELFRSGYNCAQAVFAAFSDITGIDLNTSLKIASPFGGGFGRMREMCGAVCGMCLAAGCIFGYDNIENREAKTCLYETVHSMLTDFKEEMGSYVCKEILGIRKMIYSPVSGERTKEFYKNRPCEKCVITAAGLMDKKIREKETDTGDKR